MTWDKITSLSILVFLVGMAIGSLVFPEPPKCPECPDPFPLKGEIFYDVEKKQLHVYKGWVKLEESLIDKVLMDEEGKLFRLKEIGDIENGLFE